ncbi:transglutaminase-like domain-containing protein [Leptolyngbya sp. NIES-2104]|uniref:transglutaminase-like domain-containing protein n=1 Tax=Leptolyngbya sp. NIES-2104 TaxID=1552121 RepID=UPI000A7026CA|nr:transglutaminase-like domain-containing protein [Leptolyngbya sp. NIES-2104]
MMHLELETSNLDAYLEASDVIDFEQPIIREIAAQLIRAETTDVARAKRIYEFVRDRVSHTFDIQGDIVTCQASEVLQHRQGICFAKSHLLAAILRCVGIPTGFCYQRLLFEQENAPEFTLHGLNAIYLASVGRWIRVDARGNKPGVQAELCLEKEMLAFPIRAELHETDFAIVYSRPNVNVITALRNSETIAQLIQHLPDEL